MFGMARLTEMLGFHTKKIAFSQMLILKNRILTIFIGPSKYPN